MRFFRILEITAIKPPQCDNENIKITIKKYKYTYNNSSMHDFLMLTIFLDFSAPKSRAGSHIFGILKIERVAKIYLFNIGTCRNARICVFSIIIFFSKFFRRS